MPRNTVNETPVKLRVHVSNRLHQRLIQLCGQQTLEEGRMVGMSEMVRELLEKAAERELSQATCR